MTDQRLLERAQTGEADAFDRLFHEHKDGVYACLWHLLGGDADTVEDAVGGVFFSAYRNLDRFRGDASFKTWLYRIAVNEAHACIRRNRRHTLLAQLWPHGDDNRNEPGSAADDPAERFLRSEEERTLWRAVQVLPEPYRTPVILRYVNGMSSIDIARVLGRPAGTIRYQLSRALQVLRERLGSEWTE
jgi:RNA polymerase sigma-70 factor, ECF subfamily